MSTTIRRLATNHVGANGGATRLLAADGSDLSIPVPLRPEYGNGLDEPSGTIGQLVSEIAYADESTQMGLTVSTNMDIANGNRVNPFQPVGGAGYRTEQSDLTLTTTPTVFAPTWTQEASQVYGIGYPMMGDFTAELEAARLAASVYIPDSGISCSNGIWTLPANGIWRVQLVLNSVTPSGEQVVNAYWDSPDDTSGLRYGCSSSNFQTSGAGNGLGFEALLTTFSQTRFRLMLSSASINTVLSNASSFGTHISFCLLAGHPASS